MAEGVAAEAGEIASRAFLSQRAREQSRVAADQIGGDKKLPHPPPLPPPRPAPSVEFEQMETKAEIT